MNPIKGSLITVLCLFAINFFKHLMMKFVLENCDCILLWFFTNIGPAPQPSCMAALPECCEPFSDPTTSCAAVEQGEECYCDALCYERNDCCMSINGMPIMPPSCVPSNVCVFVMYV